MIQGAATDWNSSFLEIVVVMVGGRVAECFEDQMNSGNTWCGFETISSPTSAPLPVRSSVSSNSS